MRRNYFIVLIIFLIFFVISFLTNILGPIIPEFIKSFGLSNSMAGFLPFAFFIAYIISIPAGLIAEKFKPRTLMQLAFLLMLIGALCFSLFPRYLIALISLFTIGIGMAMLQVIINPLLRTAGGEENFAFNAVIAQLIFGVASFISPKVYTSLVTNLSDTTASTRIINLLRGIVPADLNWVSIYWIFCLIVVMMFIIVSLVKLPRVDLQADEKAESWSIYKLLLNRRIVILYIIGIFAYVGTEQSLSNWMSRFLEQYHGVDPLTTGANAVSNFWGLMMIGCLLGMLMLKLIDSKKVLAIFSTAAIGCLSIALFGSTRLSIIAFPMCGFFLSVMWSVIFSLALNSLDNHHGAFSGLLCTAIIGGAIVPWLVGLLGDLIGLRFSLVLLFFSLGYIFSITIWAKPLVNNKTISIS